jgi:hypothetical protein
MQLLVPQHNLSAHQQLKMFPSTTHSMETLTSWLPCLNYYAGGGIQFHVPEMIKISGFHIDIGELILCCPKVCHC